MAVLAVCVALVVGGIGGYFVGRSTTTIRVQVDGPQPTPFESAIMSRVELTQRRVAEMSALRQKLKSEGKSEAEIAVAVERLMDEQLGNKPATTRSSGG
jgi:uncharacterized protein YneF (UPF0154 family)